MAAFGTAGSAHAETLQELSRLSLEELANVEVTSVSKRPESVGEAAASIFVISSDDIRRSGAVSLPEVLRLAPNLIVQQVNAADYSITARGFSGYETANKFLVLVDGRSIYDPLHSGILWDAQTLLLQDIDRIEVLSGPGGALYGANAVNGVINIITKSATDTQGVLVNAQAGDQDERLALRYGGRIGRTGAYSLYAVGFELQPTRLETGGSALDRGQGARAGVRADFGKLDNALTLQAEVFRHDVLGDAEIDGGFIESRWSRALAGGGRLEGQAYHYVNQRELPLTAESTRTTDLLVQHTLAPFARQQLVWGAGYRNIEDRFDTAFAGAFLDPARRTVTLANVFAQDQIALRDDLTLTLGAKYEDSSFTGGEFLPSLRLGWRSGNGNLVWAAVSRAARTPSRIDRDLSAPGLLAPGQMQSEKLTAYEIGYRATLRANMSVSITAFRHDYDGLRTVPLGPGGTLPATFGNGGEGRLTGVEAWGSYDVNPRWRLSAGVTTIDKDFHLRPGETALSGLASIGDDPDTQFLLRSEMEIGDRLELDVRLRAVDAVTSIPGYTEADMRLGWRVNDRAELSISGENLLGDGHLEAQDPARRRVVDRRVRAGLRLTL